MDRISHESRTPLITVKGYTSYLIELMEQHIDFTYLDLLSSLRLIEKGCDRLEDVIDSILLTKDIKTGELHTILKLHVNSVITDLVKKYEKMGLNRNHNISVKVPEDLYLECDPFHFRLVFYHLVSNALKFIPPHGYIQIKGIEENEKLKISVKDNGIGLTKAEMNRIFTKFGKIERFGRGWDIEGSGIGNGLYLSKLVVEL